MEKMEEMQAAELARHRVDQGAGGYYAKIMSDMEENDIGIKEDR